MKVLSSLSLSVLFLLTPMAWPQSQETGHTLPAGAQNIQHVIIIVEENRSTDNLFQDPKLMAEGADIATYGINTKGQQIPLAPRPLADIYDLDHSHHSWELQYDHGKMDGANLIHADCQNKKCPPNPPFAYVQASDVEPYFQIAEDYTFADRMFQTNQGPSFPAHQFLLSATSAPTATSDLFASEDINGPLQHGNWDMGCDGPPKNLVHLINPQGNEAQEMFPCFDHPTLTDLLDNAGVSWLYYTSATKSIWTAPNAISHIRNGHDWSKIVLPQTRILTDISKGDLPGVSWVMPSGQASDHPWMNTGLGPSWIASIVNAVGNSSYWDNTVILITWDDWGGFYDHVAPPQVLINCEQWGCGYVYGFRVPLLVVSQFAKRGYISHVDHDFGSIIKFVETLFDLPSLGYADAFADDLSDCFNSDNQRSKFHPIAAPHDAKYFLNDHTPPTDVDDD